MLMRMITLSRQSTTNLKAYIEVRSEQISTSLNGFVVEGRKDLKFFKKQMKQQMVKYRL